MHKISYLPIHTRSTIPHLTTFNAQYSSFPILQYLTHSVLVLMLDPDVVVVTDVEASNVDLDSPLFPLAISTECHDCSSWNRYSIGRLTCYFYSHYCSTRLWARAAEREYKTQHNISICLILWNSVQVELAFCYVYLFIKMLGGWKWLFDCHPHLWFFLQHEYKEKKNSSQEHIRTGG